MEFQPYIDSRKSNHRRCNCGRDHTIKIIHGMFYYAESNHVAFCVALVEHSDEKHIWVAFITGEWPGTNAADCFVTSHIWSNTEDRIMKVEDGTTSPFEKDEIFDCYPVTREQVLAVDGAKDWFINTYLKLFEIDNEIGNFIS
ncbi:MAG: hypothetical protein HY273_17390 [Gammaproteobacteria bacterium]|nr:hypothetical protein [Gammaproteobacteria bacterium]